MYRATTQEARTVTLTFSIFGIYSLNLFETMPIICPPNRRCCFLPSGTLLFFLPALLALSLTACSPPAGILREAEETTQVIRPGVLHRAIRDPRGPWNIHVLEVDLRQPDLFFETARARDSLYGRETTSDMARRKTDSLVTVLAAVNADFFDLKTGESVNNQVAGGMVVRAVVPAYGGAGEYRGVRSQIGFSREGRPILDRLVFDGRVFWRSGAVSAITGVNVIRLRTDLVLLNSYSGRIPRPDSLRGRRAWLPLRVIGRSGDTLLVLAGRTERGSGHVRPTNDAPVLLSINTPQLFDSLGTAEGDTLKVFLGFRPSSAGIRALVGGIPRLVRNSVSVVGAPGALEGASEEFSEKRHPRTGIGFSRDSSMVYLVTVDGRQRESVGMSLEEFAQLMISLGVSEGLNLDGGGSTTMVIRGAIVNSPSDASGERPVANAVLLMERRR
jgi:Phosphodiester glycosidase